MKDAEAKQQIHRTRCDSRARMTLARKRVPFSIRDYLTAIEKDGEKKKNKGKKEVRRKERTGRQGGKDRLEYKKK